MKPQGKAATMIVQLTHMHHSPKNSGQDVFAMERPAAVSRPEVAELSQALWYQFRVFPRACMHCNNMAPRKQRLTGIDRFKVNLVSSNKQLSVCLRIK